MADLTNAKIASANALRVIKYGDGQTLTFLRYKNTQTFETIAHVVIEDNFGVDSQSRSSTVEGRQVGANLDVLTFADVDGIFYDICHRATACAIDGVIHKLGIKSIPRKYVNDDTDFSRVWEWFMADTGETLQ